jgi:hypothetical protein
MFWKKDSPQTIIVPKVTHLALGEAWSQLLSQYDSLRAHAEGGWNKIHFLGILNSFLAQHSRLSERFPGDYGKWERPLVEAAYVSKKEGRSISPAMETDFSRLDETESKAACWKELLASYCRIHGSLQVEWRAWNDNEYREFVAIIDQLRSAVTQVKSRRKV